MLPISSKKWIPVFLFYGLVCFCLGFFGSLEREVTGYARKKSIPAEVKHPNLVDQSENYLSGLVANLINRKRQDAVIPAFGTISPPPLFFCHSLKTEALFPETFIKKFNTHFNELFSCVNEIFLSGDSNWEDTISLILAEEPRSVIFGVNLPGLDSETPVVNVKIYLCVPENLPQAFPMLLKKYSQIIDTFFLSKQRLKDRDLYILTWEDTRGEFLNNLELCCNDLLELLEEQLPRRQKPI